MVAHEEGGAVEGHILDAPQLDPKVSIEEELKERADPLEEPLVKPEVGRVG
jgi:hypothetical protein